MSQRAFARRMKCDPKAVRVALRDTRIPPHLVAPDGKILDPEAAEVAWRANTLSDRVPLTGRTAPKPSGCDDPHAPHLALGDGALSVRYPLAGFLAGATAALREAGREATPEALEAAVEAVKVETWWALAVVTLTSRVDPAVPLEEIRAAWELAGREAAGRLP